MSKIIILPQLPSATTIEKDGGFDLGKMQQLHLMKTEELYCTMFQMMKRIDELEAKITVLKKINRYYFFIS
ncbi:MAG: hypothetical protein IPP29_25250 [Bacteroidetes bacterium]|nr:hypothetical protein [Bacteroidota bacterium]